MSIDGDDLTALLSPAELAARETGGALLAQRHRDHRRQPLSRRRADRAGARSGRRHRRHRPRGRLRRSRSVRCIHAFGWKLDDWGRLAAGTLAGHLLECGSQITGGYFADPPFKNVPGMADLGYPIAEIDADGGMVITKPAATGGRVDRLHRHRAAALRNSRSLGLSGARRGARRDRRDGRGGGARPRARHRRARQTRSRDAEGHASASMAACSAKRRSPTRGRMRRRARGWRPQTIGARMNATGARPRRSASTRSAWSACSATPARWRGRGLRLRRCPAAVRRPISNAGRGRASARRSRGALLRGPGRRRGRAASVSRLGSPAPRA